MRHDNETCILSHPTSYNMHIHSHLTHKHTLGTYMCHTAVGPQLQKQLPENLSPSFSYVPLPLKFIPLNSHLARGEDRSSKFHIIKIKNNSYSQILTFLYTSEIFYYVSEKQLCFLNEKLNGTTLEFHR